MHYMSLIQTDAASVLVLCADCHGHPVLSREETDTERHLPVRVGQLPILQKEPHWLAKLHQAQPLSQ